eukprot:NODE_292_length_10587_cov_0.520881.p1 type:complete len:815 gc:universal NODE_292_length_10587_cov_0.520881:4924-7368(+)
MEVELNLNPVFSQDELMQLNSILVLLPTSDEHKQKIKQFIDTLFEREKLLSQKVFELTETFATAALSETTTISDIKKQNAKYQIDIKKAWNLLEIAHQKEMEQTQQISVLTFKIDTIMSSGNDLQLLTLSQDNKELKQDKNDLNEQVRQLQKDKGEIVNKLSKNEENTQILNSKCSQMENDFYNLQQMLNQAEISLGIKDDELTNFKAQSEYKEVELKSRNELITYLKEELKNVEKGLEEERKLKDFTFKELELANTTLKKLESQVKALKKERIEGEAKLKMIEFEMKTQEKDYEVLSLDKQNSDRLKDGLVRKMQGVESKKAELKALLDLKDDSIFNLEREIVCLREETDATREENRQLKNLNDKLKESNSELQVKNSNGLYNLKQLEIDIISHKKANKTFQEEAIKMRKIIEALEHEQCDFQTRIHTKDKSIKDLDQEILGLKEELYEQTQQTIELKKKFSNHQNLYEQTRSDRNRYAKDVMDVNSELKDSRVKLEAMTHQILQLEQQLQSKNESSTKNHFSVLKISKEKEHLIEEIDLLTRQSKISKCKIEELKSDNIQLSQNSNDYCEEIQKYQLKIDDLNRKNESQQQLIEKKSGKIDEEVAKVERLQGQLDRSTKDMREIDFKNKSLNDEVKHYQKKIRLIELHGKNVFKFQQEVIELKKQLLDEQIRGKALQEEMDRPQNIHHWRSIQAVDPDRYSLMEKVADLQRKLIKKDDEILKVQNSLSVTKNLNDDLNRILSRVPSTDIIMEIESLKSTSSKKTSQIQALESEIKMYRDCIGNKSKEIELLKTKLNESKSSLPKKIRMVNIK